MNLIGGMREKFCDWFEIILVGYVGKEEGGWGVGDMIGRGVGR